MLYLLYGSDDYSRQRYIADMVSRTGLPRIDFAADAIPTNTDALLAQDLFSAGQLIVLENAMQKFLLEEHIDSFSASNNHILFIESKLDLRTKLAKQLLSDRRIVAKEFNAPTVEQLPVWVIEYARFKGAVITDSAARLLLQRLGYIDPLGGLLLALREPSLGRLACEIDKLITYANGESIANQMVIDLVADDRQALTLSIADSLARKNRQQLVQLLESYYTGGAGEDETSKTLALVGLLADQFRSQLLVKDALERRVPEAELLALTGWKSGRLFVVKRLASGFAVPRLRDALSKLESLDIELKTTSTPPRVVLELILAQMV